jgi:hypothetical protein
MTWLRFLRCMGVLVVGSIVLAIVTGNFIVCVCAAIATLLWVVLYAELVWEAPRHE